MNEFYRPGGSLSRGNTDYDEPENIKIVVDNEGGSSSKSFCVHCGNELDEGDAFCSKCGTTVNGAEQSDRHIKCGYDGYVGESFGGGLKNKYISLLLCFFFGHLGAHKFYEGSTLKGVFRAVLIGSVLPFGTIGAITNDYSPFISDLCVLLIILSLTADSILWIADFFKLLGKPKKYKP